MPPMLQSRIILAKAKDANNEGRKRPGYRKNKQRRTSNNGGRTTGFGKNEVDEEALDIIGGECQAPGGKNVSVRLVHV